MTILRPGSKEFGCTPQVKNNGYAELAVRMQKSRRGHYQTKDCQREAGIIYIYNSSAS